MNSGGEDGKIFSVGQLSVEKRTGLGYNEIRVFVSVLKNIGKA